MQANVLASFSSPTLFVYSNMKHLLKKLQAKTKQIKPTSIRTILAEMMAHRIQLISQLHLKATPQIGRAHV